MSKAMAILVDGSNKVAMRVGLALERMILTCNFPFLLGLASSFSLLLSWLLCL